MPTSGRSNQLSTDTGEVQSSSPVRELLEAVDMLKERRIHFQSLEEKIDTSSAAGELIFYVFGAIAHFERRLIGERTKDGLAAAKAKGRRPGRPP